MPVPFEVTYRNSSSPQSLRHITTRDLHPTSPAPRFEIERSRRRSLSPVPGSPPMASKTMYSPPPLTWSTAAQDAKAGICYTKEFFPTSSFLPPPFSREPVSVEAAERVEVLEEVDEYAVRVRVLRTGAVGLIPAWNTEGALERLTRINTAFNEAATCPVEARALRRRDSESSAHSISSDGSDNAPLPSPTSPADTSLTHVHARCVPFATRVRYPDFYGLPSPFSDSDGDGDSDSDEDAPSPLTPQSPPSRGRSPFRSSRWSPVEEPAVYEAPANTVEKGAISMSSGAVSTGGGGNSKSGVVGSPSQSRKAVNFGTDSERPRVVFRYPSEELVLMEGLRKLAADSDRAAGGEVHEDEEEGDDEWWWHGWEEPTEELELELEEDQEGEAEAVARAGPEGEEGTDEKLISATFDVRGVFEPLEFHPEDL